MDSVRSGPFGQIFRPDNFVFGMQVCFVYMLLSQEDATVALNVWVIKSSSTSELSNVQSYG